MTIRKFKKIHYTHQNIKWLIDFIHANLDKYNHNNSAIISFTESRIITNYVTSLMAMYCSSHSSVLPSSYLTMTKFNELIDILRKVHNEDKFDPLFNCSTSINTLTTSIDTSIAAVSNNEYAKPENIFDEHTIKSNKNFTIKIKYNNKFYKAKSLICAFDSDGLAYYGFVTTAVTMWVSQNSPVELEIGSVIGKSIVTVAESAPYQYFG